MIFFSIWNRQIVSSIIKKERMILNLSSVLGILKFCGYHYTQPFLRWLYILSHLKIGLKYTAKLFKYNVRILFRRKEIAVLSGSNITTVLGLLLKYDSKEWW